MAPPAWAAVLDMKVTLVMTARSETVSAPPWLALPLNRVRFSRVAFSGAGTLKMRSVAPPLMVITPPPSMVTARLIFWVWVMVKVWAPPGQAKVTRPPVVAVALMMAARRLAALQVVTTTLAAWAGAARPNNKTPRTKLGAARLATIAARRRRENGMAAPANETD